MTKPKFGIVSGAGPIAGALLYQQTITLLQEKGCYQDADFPEIIIHNVPFADMLDGHCDNPTVSQQLEESLTFLSKRVDVIYIACQTLHLFLSEETLSLLKVKSLMQLVDEVCGSSTAPLQIVASRTSAKNKLHQQRMKTPAHYIEMEKSAEAINEILKGHTPDLDFVYQASLKGPVLLGCTEYTIPLQNSDWNVIDPIILAAKDMTNRFLNS